MWKRSIVWILLDNCQLTMGLLRLLLGFFFFFIPFQSVFINFFFDVLVIRFFYFFLILYYIKSLWVRKLWWLMHFFSRSIFYWFLNQLIFHVSISHKVFFNCIFKIIFDIDCLIGTIMLWVIFRNIFYRNEIFFACGWQWTFFLLFIDLVVICLYHTFFIFINWVERLV